MAHVESSIEVDVPVSTAYDQWTQFESFPHYMEGVESVEQITDSKVRFTANVAGKQRSWNAKIVEQEPDRKIAWRSTEGARNDGIVRFQSLGAQRCRIDLRLDFDPDTVVEAIGAEAGLLERRVKGDLDRFKEYVEKRGRAEGAWRGEIDSGRRVH